MKIRITIIAALIALFSVLSIHEAQAQVSVRIGTPARHHRTQVVRQRTVVRHRPVVVRRRPVVVHERVVVRERPVRRHRRNYH